MNRMHIFFCAASLVIALSFSAGVQNTAVKIDLNGTWMDGSREVTITHTGSSVVAKFNAPPMCDPQDKSTPKPRETNFTATLNGNTLDGDATVCNYGEKWGSKIGIQSVKMTLTVSQDQQTLDGTYAGWKGPAKMTLTRKCTPNQGELCKGVGAGNQVMKGALSATPSAAFYQSLQQNLGAELSRIKGQVCDDPTKAAKIDELQRDLDSLNYVPGQSNFQNNRTLARLEGEFKQLAVDWCGRASKDIPPPPSCSQGSQSKTDADTKWLNSFGPALETNLTVVVAGPGTILRQRQTRACLKQMFGEYCLPNGFIKNLRIAASSWEQEVPPSTDTCRQACQALGASYAASACSDGGLPEAKLVDKCILTCRTHNFTQ